MKRKLPSVGLEERFPHDYDTSFHWRVFSYGRRETRGKHKICRVQNWMKRDVCALESLI